MGNISVVTAANPLHKGQYLPSNSSELSQSLLKQKAIFMYITPALRGNEWSFV